jgi:pyruvate kinase
MLDAGMDVARLNFSHGDHKSHGASVNNLREALKQRPDAVCAVMLDTKGPEIRTGMLEDGKVTFVKDQDLEICTDYELKGNSKKISCSYESLATTVAVGSTIYIADGSLTCRVTELLEDGVKVKVLNNCTLGERKNMNLPGAIVDLPTLTEKDEDDLCDFGLKYGVDMVAASFVRKAEDIETIRDVLGPRGAHIKIIAKIENQEGLNNYDEILEATDGIMVARGDLGMEIPPEKVFIAQKWMIEKANLAAKPVVTATQMLESMINAPRPTRAEASDVANAVLDGTDCVMLSGESANGQYPLEAVGMMARCCAEAERTIDYKRLYSDTRAFSPAPVPTAEAVAAAAVGTVIDCNIDLVIVLTDSGKLARLVSKYRPNCPILACSVSNPVIRQLNCTRGVIGYKMPSFQGTDQLLQLVIKTARDMGLCASGHKVVTIHGTKEETPDESNIMKILDIE